MTPSATGCPTSTSPDCAATSSSLRPPDTLDDQEQTRLERVLARCPHLEAAAGHVAAFAEMLTGLHGDRLDTWIGKVDADDLPDLHAFTTGLRRDHQAVTNGLTLPSSSGPVEGNINRIKMLKRQMYGRPGFALLPSGSCSRCDTALASRPWPSTCTLAR